MELLETRRKASLGLYISTLNYPLPKNMSDIYDVHSYHEYPAHIYLAKSAKQEVQGALSRLRDLVRKSKTGYSQNSQTGNNIDIVEQLEKLGKLFQNGTLTKEEYELAKKKLLNS
jgi:phosphoribosylamine-glycine ligase